MFEIGWTEMLVIAIVMIVVVGPKDLPKMLRTFGRTTAKLRSMAGDFQRQFNEALKEAELDDVKKSVDSLRSLNPANEIRKQLNPFEKAAADVRAGVDAAMKPAPKSAETAVPAAEPTSPAPAQPAPLASQPADPLTHSAEPLKAGPTAMPGSVDEPSAAAAPAASAAPAKPATSDSATAPFADKREAPTAANNTAGNAS